MELDVDEESNRLIQSELREDNWQRFGPYLAERQWSTVREDYSSDGNCWEYFSHDHSRSRTYRFGEDGLFGITDRECRLCFSVAFWNEKDPILKERLFGLTGPEGNHGEDVKEQYFYLESTPTHSYMKSLYKYPQNEYPYSKLLNESLLRKSDLKKMEYEILDTGIFDENEYFDIFTEYSKNDPNDILIKISIFNRSNKDANLHVLPTLFHRNWWAWGCKYETCDWLKPIIKENNKEVVASQKSSGLEDFIFQAEAIEKEFVKGQEIGKNCKLGKKVEWIFTENETNFKKLYGSENTYPYVKDAFHNYVISNDTSCVNPNKRGTKCASHYVLNFGPNGEVVLKLRLRWSKSEISPEQVFGNFDEIFKLREKEKDIFYSKKIPSTLTKEEKNVAIQAYAGLLYSKKFYHYVVEDWIDGDPNFPVPPEERKKGRNSEWRHFFARDIIMMPDNFEYPWFANWDAAFHIVTIANIDIYFAKRQVLLLLKDWYMNPQGQIPAYEFSFSDVNPPTLVWSAWKVFKKTKKSEGKLDFDFLATVFNRFLINFTWWVNKKDVNGNNLFSGGFLGLDNIGVFDRSQKLPIGDAQIIQSDGTSWISFYCVLMLKISLALAEHNKSYEDIATKFFEHFVTISKSINTFCGTGLWDQTDGFYYDHLLFNDHITSIPLRSMVGLVPFYAVGNFPSTILDKYPQFMKRTSWFFENKKELSKEVSKDEKLIQLSIPKEHHILTAFKYVFDENEFLSKYGIRSLSKYYEKNPYFFKTETETYSVKYCPAESETFMFGGNSNWRGPIWLPTNYLFIDCLQKIDNYYGKSFQMEYPTGSGIKKNFLEIKQDIEQRIVNLFLPDENGNRPCHGGDPRWAKDPHWKDYILFYEYFHGDNGRGCGANHQTGWTALVCNILLDLGKQRSRALEKENIL